MGHLEDSSGLRLTSNLKDPTLRPAKGLGFPVHPAVHAHSADVPDGARTSGSVTEEWEQDWENAQIDAEDTIVAIEGLEAEAEGWISDLQNAVAPRPSDVEGPARPESKFDGETAGFEPSDGPMVDCLASDADANSNTDTMDCVGEISIAIGEAFGALAGYLGNKQVVKDALANSRNAVSVALAAFTGGTLTASGLLSAATTAITAVAGSTAVGWAAAAGIAFVTAGTIYLLAECLLNTEPETAL